MANPNPNDFRDYEMYGSYLGGSSSNPNNLQQIPNIFPQFRPLTPEQQHAMYLEQQRMYNACLQVNQANQQVQVQREALPETQPQNESVPETQPQTQKQKRKHQKKAKGKDEALTKRCTPWTSPEEAWLSQCWLDSSENSKKGNSQKREALWSAIYNKFNNNNRGWKRGDDQLSSKWRNINRNCHEFHSVYNDVRRNWRSGANDHDIMERAHVLYRNNFGKKFTMMDSWLVLKDKPKWYAPAPVGGDDDEECDDSTYVPLSQNELFGDDPIERPEGREKAKKAARKSQQSDAPTSSRSTRSSKAEEFMENMSKFKEDMTENRKKTLSELEKQETLRTAFQGASILSVNADNVTNKKHKKYLQKFQKLYIDKFAYLVDDDKNKDNEDEEETDESE